MIQIQLMLQPIGCKSTCRRYRRVGCDTCDECFRCRVGPNRLGAAPQNVQTSQGQHAARAFVGWLTYIKDGTEFDRDGLSAEIVVHNADGGVHITVPGTPEDPSFGTRSPGSNRTRLSRHELERRLMPAHNLIGTPSSASVMIRYLRDHVRATP